MLSKEVSPLRVVLRLFSLPYSRLTVGVKDLCVDILVFVLPRYCHESVSLSRFGSPKRLICMIGYLRDVLMFLRLL